MKVKKDNRCFSGGVFNFDSFVSHQSGHPEDERRQARGQNQQRPLGPDSEGQSAVPIVWSWSKDQTQPTDLRDQMSVARAFLSTTRCVLGAQTISFVLRLCCGYPKHNRLATLELQILQTRPATPVWPHWFSSHHHRRHHHLNAPSRNSSTSGASPLSRGMWARWWRGRSWTKGGPNKWEAQVVRFSPLASQPHWPLLNPMPTTMPQTTTRTAKRGPNDNPVTKRQQQPNDNPAT